MRPFKLQFESDKIPLLAARYDSREDTCALAAGKLIRAGAYTRKNLETIFEWKTKGRGRSRLSHNTDAEIRDTLALAATAKTARAATAVLTGLSGVAIPVASAILTAINPDRYTIIDFRALEALGNKQEEQKAPTVDYYLEYLKYCRSLAKDADVSLRTLDRALWRWSNEN